MTPDGRSSSVIIVESVLFDAWFPGTKYAEQRSQMSRSAKPSVRTASMIWRLRSLSKLVARRTYDAPLTATVAQMSSGRSRLPPGVVAVRAPGGVVAECWPPVMPKLKLLSTSTVRPMFRRAAASRWAPPIPVPPSPMMTITFSSGRASLMPVAYVMLRPCRPWKALVTKY